MPTGHMVYDQVTHPIFGHGTIREIKDDNLIVSFDQNLTTITFTPEEHYELEF